MGEVFPVVAGILTGIIALRIASQQMRYLTVAVLAVVFGVTATIISGEALVSWAFLLIDIPLVLVSAVATMVVVPYVMERYVHQQS